MNKLLKHLNTKCYTCVGFYLTAAAALFGLIGAIIFSNGFSTPAYAEYYSPTALTFAIIGFVLFFPLIATKYTANITPKVILAFTFAALLAFVNCSYMYLAGIFFSGITAEAFAAIDPAWMNGAIFMGLGFILSNFAVWFKQAKEDKQETTQNIDNQSKKEVTV